MKYLLDVSRSAFFCQYSWKNKFSQKSSDGYTSGIQDRETLFQDMDYEVYKNGYLVTAIDGSTESCRMVINKPISNKLICSKLNEFYESSKEYAGLKLYCILGYPFETDFNPGEFLSVVDSINKPSDKILNIFMNSTHFVPMPFTPMEREAVNFINFREKIKQYDFKKWHRDTIKVYWNWTTVTTPISAAEQTICNRGAASDQALVKKILLSSKYKSGNYRQKTRVIHKYFGHLIGKQESVLDYIERPYNVENGIRLYESRKKELINPN